MTTTESPTRYASFEDYKQSLEFLVMVSEPEIARLNAAREAGGREPGHPSSAPYLYDRLRAAFFGR